MVDDGDIKFPAKPSPLHQAIAAVLVALVTSIEHQPLASGELAHKIDYPSVAKHLRNLERIAPYTPLDAERNEHTGQLLKLILQFFDHTDT